MFPSPKAVSIPFNIFPILPERSETSIHVSSPLKKLFIASLPDLPPPNNCLATCLSDIPLSFKNDAKLSLSLLLCKLNVFKSESYLNSQSPVGSTNIIGLLKAYLYGVQLGACSANGSTDIKIEILGS